VVPDIVSCNTLISAYAKAGEPELAFEALHLMRQSGILLNDFTVGAMIRVAAHRGDED
jgi:pentatricopeptide repeat protein